MTRIDIYFDGACKNVKESVNEPYGVGVAVFLDGDYLEEESKALYFPENGTSNIAEWEGCLQAMKIAEQLFLDIQDNVDIRIYSDSQLITNQFNEYFKTKMDRFFKYKNASKLIANRIKFGEIVWVPREKNTEADKLSKIALSSKSNS